MLRPQTDTTSQALAAPIRSEVATISRSLEAKRRSFIENSLLLVYDSHNNPMDEEHPAKRQKSRWWPTSKGAMRIFAALIAVGALLFVFRGYYTENLRDRPLTVLGAATVVAAVVVLIRVGEHYQWTGFGESGQRKLDNQEIQPRKTLWDWLQLFIVPLALAAIGLWFAAQQDAHQQKIEAKRAESDRHIEEQRAQDAALQAYLDQMSQLMLNGNLRGSKEGSEVRTLARARTQTVLGRLDGRRKGSVVQFLYEASLIDKENPVVSFSAVRLRGADLSDVELHDANLSGTYLNDANLSGTSLHDANLSGAHLSGANLSDANLISAEVSNAYLSDANLRNANLLEANLSGTELNDANLSHAYLNDANLGDGADLIDANLSNAELVQANLIGAYLIDANLSDANLSDANLRNANLSDANLISDEISNANLYDANLSGAHLSGANLSGADLRIANLSGANVSGADLSGAVLSVAVLRGADLRGANLSGAELSVANLSGADLSGANLSGAKLSGANLSGATGVTEEQLEKQAKLLEGATMPDGSIRH
jgi:uncharacterized protein YjbI with pentapeptide repeats